MGLFTPAWMGKNKEKALNAVEKETDQLKLADIAKNAYFSIVCDEALKKITDQSILADVAKNGNEASVRRDAVKKLRDQTVLAEIAKTDSDFLTRSEAVEKLTDQFVLIDIAKNDTESSVRGYAVRRMTDQTVLIDIAMNNNDCRLRQEAVGNRRFTDQVVLADIAKNDSEWNVRKKAVEKLTDQSVLTEIALTDKHKEVQKCAADKIKDTDVKNQSSIMKYDVESICKKIMSRKQSDMEDITMKIYEMIDFRLFTPESRNSIILALLSGMKRLVSDEYDSSLAGIVTANFKHNADFNGNRYLGQLLFMIYKNEDITPKEKEEIEKLDGMLVSYDYYHHPVYFDLEKGTRI